MDNSLDSELIKKAYKKLKSSVYFDKTQLVLRDQIVEFEGDISESDLENHLEKLWDKFATSADKEWNKAESKLLNSIGSLSFPKKLAEDKCSIIMNTVNEITEIKEIQNFFQASVDVHILGVLWLLLIGWQIDKETYEHSYGNRIRKNLINELSKKPTYSPYLFEPYFEQYESWRDTALKHAEKCIDRQQDVVIITMDFRRFYYSVDFDESSRDTILDDANIEAEDLILFRRVNNFIYKVIEKYSANFKNEYDGRNILPIGFLPSNVLANWCLKNFDKAVVDGWNPVYFGRYVDDILIVDKVEKNCSIYEKAKQQKLTKPEIIEYFMEQCSKWKGFNPKCIGQQDMSLLCEDKELTKVEVLKETERRGILSEAQEKDIHVYAVNSLYNMTRKSKSKVIVHNDKVKVFYFSSGQSTALLDCFQKNISKNKSEFRCMPEDSAIFLDDDYSEIYSLQETDGINKLRGVDGISIDKFALSKFLGKYLRISGLVNDKLESHFEKDIEKVFDSHAIVDNYTTWEKVIEIFVINDRYEALYNFVCKIKRSIDNIRYINVVSETSADEIKYALFLFLRSSLCRAFSLNWGVKSKEYLDKVHQIFYADNHIYASEFQYSVLLNYRQNYYLTRMNDKYVMPVIIDEIIENSEEIFNDSQERKLTDFDNTTRENYRIPSFEYVYYPYMITMSDLAIVYEFENMKSSSNRQGNKSFVLKQQKEAYVKCNYAPILPKEYMKNAELGVIDCMTWGEDPFKYAIKVGEDTCDTISIAVASVKVLDENFELLVKDTPNRSYKRYSALASTVNQAIKEKADMLVLPESYVPFEWLATLARTCAKNQLAVITGVEHIKIKSPSGSRKKAKIYNLTAVILPYKEDEYNCAHIVFHLKKHYAPKEIQEIEGYRLKPVLGDSYELYCWKDCWFPVYCCYELASIIDRSIFQSYADLLIAVEWNPDVNYYSNILESLSRDLHCYCVQVNSSNYGDSRITTPSKSEKKDIIKTKGGINNTILVDKIDIKALRDFQFMEYELQKNNSTFKPTPPDFDKKIVFSKMQHKLYDEMKKETKELNIDEDIL